MRTQANSLMGPFPPTSELPAFVGDSIAQVRLDPYSVQFAFESGLLLTAEYEIEQTGPDGMRYKYDCSAAEGPPLLLHRLLYRPISAIFRSELSLAFELEGGYRLTIYMDVGPYESGHISGESYGFAVF